MHCTRIRFENGDTAIVCGARYERVRCRWCHKWAAALCDWKLANRTTCDAPACRDHSEHGGHEIDYCALHGRGTATLEAEA